MPLPLSSIAIEEKNKLANSSSVFLILAEIDIPGLAEKVRLIANTEAYALAEYYVDQGYVLDGYAFVSSHQWCGEDWQAFPFELDEIVDGDSGEVSRVDVRVSNVSREMETYLHQYDAYCKANGFEPVLCTIYVINSLNLASSTPECELKFKLIQPKTSSEWVTFTLGARNVFNVRYPKRRLIPSCQWTFKGTECEYSGGETSCNKTFARCQELNNTIRFGGFYVTD